MQREYRTFLFMHIYCFAVQDNPTLPRYVCYLRSEAEFLEITGFRQFSNYPSFRVAYCNWYKRKTCIKRKVFISPDKIESCVLAANKPELWQRLSTILAQKKC